MVTAYLAGPIFSESDQMFNEKLALGIRKNFPGINLYVPQENKSINDKTKCADAKMIYDGDYERLKNTDILICQIDGDIPPIGTTCEIGIFSEMMKKDQNKKLVALYTDIRDACFTINDSKIKVMSEKSAQSQFSYLNLFLLGCVLDRGVLVNSSEQLFEYMEQLYREETKKVICGIYKITNRTDGKIYIGQSIDIYKRWKQHLNFQGISHNSAIDSAIKQYGKENFDLETLEECDNSLLNDKEVYYVEKYNTYTPNGYNIAIAGGQIATNAQRIEVSKYDLDGNKLDTYISINEAARQNQITPQAIRQSIGNIAYSLTAAGFMWKEGHLDKVEPLIKPQCGVNGGKTIYCYDKTTKVFVAKYESTKKAVEDLKLDNQCRSNIISAASGKLYYAYNYIWSYIKWDVAPDNYLVLNIKNSEQNKDCNLLLINVKTLEKVSLKNLADISEFLQEPTNEIRASIKDRTSLKNWLLLDSPTEEDINDNILEICKGKYEHKKTNTIYLLDMTDYSQHILRSMVERNMYKITSQQVANGLGRGDLINKKYRVFRTQEDLNNYVLENDCSACKIGE